MSLRAATAAMKNEIGLFRQRLRTFCWTALTAQLASFYLPKQFAKSDQLLNGSDYSNCCVLRNLRLSGAFPEQSACAGVKY